MKNINDYIEKINTSKEDLMVEFHKNMKDEEFKNIANSINLKDEYLMKYHEDKVELMKPIMEELGIWGKNNLEPLTEEHYKQMEESLDIETILSEVTKSYNYFKTLV